ncbi:cupin domain-containing protein [Paracraurococcus ruber]|nr:hypothetical protein [Paracraurococcus ruber]TDG29482.1 hypothetical protein E2C05_17690 [Paracraurococcus ruber]
MPMMAVEGRSFVISLEQAIWQPTGLRHGARSLLGAEFCSLSIDDNAWFRVPALLQVLILQAAAIAG